MLKFIQNNREITALLAVVLLFELAGKSLAALWSVNAEQEAA